MPHRNVGAFLNLIVRLPPTQAAVNMIQFNRDIIVSASGDHLVKIWSIETGQCLRTLEGHERGVRVRVASGASMSRIILSP